MLFNSLSFLIFFIITLSGYFYLSKKNYNTNLIIYGLILASLYFYGIWSPKYLVLLLGSICFNYCLSYKIASTAHKQSKTALTLAIIANLTLLAYFKYTNFFVNEINDLLSVRMHVKQILLPLGISFYTFTQIAFLVDVYRKEVEPPKFSEYLLFITYFPHLIAGPILHHKEIIPQFRNTGERAFNWENVNIGILIFCVGLCKKVLLADNFALISDNLFDNLAANKQNISFIDAWTGTIAYSLRIYFDFSGYCDMAIGISKTFGILLPVNFYSPYKASNIIDFWRRWHITLSRWLRDYLYIPLGGGRCSKPRRFLNLFLTMLIGGFWHGASWLFIIWGGLHGVYLIINHGWQSVVSSFSLTFTQSKWFKIFSTLLVFILVSVAWVFFRANNLHDAVSVLKGLSSFDTLSAPLSPGFSLSWIPYQWTLVQNYTLALSLSLGLFIVWFLPNTLEIFSNYKVCLMTYKTNVRGFDLSNLVSYLNKIPKRIWVYLGLSYVICSSLGVMFYTSSLDRDLYKALPIARFADIDNASGDFRSNLYSAPILASNNKKIIFVGSSYSMGLGHFQLDYKGQTYQIDSLGMGGNPLANGFRTAMALLDTPNVHTIVFAISPLGFNSKSIFLTETPFYKQCYDGLGQLGIESPQDHLGHCGPTKLSVLDILKLYLNPDSDQFYQLHGFYNKIASIFNAQKIQYTPIDLNELHAFPKYLQEQVLASKKQDTPVQDLKNGSDETFKWEQREVFNTISPDGFIYGAFKHLAEECKKRNIRLIVYNTPTPRHADAPQIYPEHFLEKYESLVQTSMNALGIEYYNFTDLMPWNGNFMTDFIHPVHAQRPIIAKAILYNMYGKTA